MRKRIFRSIFLVAMVVLLASVMLIMGVLHAHFNNLQLAQLQEETALTAHAVANEGMHYFETMDHSMDCRITWIAADGTVLYDSRSDSESMENHLERQEVADALESGYGHSSRYSATLLEESIYSAQQLPDGTVLRLSISQNSGLTLLLGMSESILLIILVSILLALALASRLTRYIVKPLNELNLDTPMSNADYSELSPLLHRLESQQVQLKAQETELKRKQRQFDTVTRSMNEGLVLLDNKATILSMNPAAARLLNAGKKGIGSDFLSVNRSPAVCDLVYRALNGEKAEKPIQLPDGTYQMITSPIRVSGVVNGIVILLLDLTEKEKSEILRREFTANVSHELKTPLHAISGYAELLKSGLVPEQDVSQFSDKIYTEAHRMIHLVEDILRLSRLDDGTADMQWVQVDLHRLAADTLRNLASAAELADVTLSLEGESVRLKGIVPLLQTIVFNLADNSIKYNRSGGCVTVQVAETDTAVTLTVADTGIGIPEEHRERIFERFYRVDKSHSKDVGGTGLGLSIVKHAAQIHNASIHVESSTLGTTVTVTFPK